MYSWTKCCNNIIIIWLTTLFMLACSSTLFMLASSTLFMLVSSTLFMLASSTLFMLASSTLFIHVSSTLFMLASSTLPPAQPCSCWPSLTLFTHNYAVGFFVCSYWCFQISFSGSSYTVLLGAHNRNSPQSHEQRIRGKRVIVHPSYGRLNNDIALIQLERPATLNSRVSTVCLPSHDFALPLSSTCYITGKYTNFIFPRSGILWNEAFWNTVQSTPFVLSLKPFKNIYYTI